MSSEENILQDSQFHQPGGMIKFRQYARKCIKIFFPSVVFLKFFVASLVPALADQIIPLFFTGNIPNDSALALAGQFTFIGILVEVIQEGIVNSLFFYVGQCYKTNRPMALQGLKLCMILLFLFGTILSLFILFFTSDFVKLIDTPEAIVDATKQFLYMSSFSFPLMLVNAALVNHLLITTSSLLIAAQLVQVVLSFCINYFLFGQQQISLRWGIEQLGYYKIIQSFVNLVNNFIFVLVIEKSSPKNFLWDIPLLKDLKRNFTVLFNVSWGNFGDSVVRNFFYFMVTLKFVNNLGETEIGAWNLLNTIIWGFLLIPSFAVANYVKVQVGLGANKEKLELQALIKKIAKQSFFCLTAWLIVLSVAGSLCWPLMAGYFSPHNVAVQEMSTSMFYQLGWIYIVFSFNNAIDSLFFGTGRTSYIFYQSFLTNLLVYFIPWILYLVGILTPTYWWVLGLYISGMIVDFGLTSYFCVCLYL